MTRRGQGREPDERGVAMATAVTVVTIVFMLLAAVVLPVVADVDTSIRSTRLTENRALGETVLNELFAEIADKPDAEPVLAGRVSPGVQVSSAGPVAGWASWDLVNNRAVVCPAVTSPCFYYAVRQPSVTGPYLAAEAAADYALAEVTVRTGCTKSGSKCVLRRYQQRWKRRRLLDYALFTDRETLAPNLYRSPMPVDGSGASVCSYPADVGVVASPPDLQEDGTPYRDGACLDHVAVGIGEGPRDRVRGPVHTNDTQIWVCGSPVFTGRVEAAGPQPLTAYPADGCENGAQAPAVQQVMPVPVPTSVTPFLDVTPMAYRFAGSLTFELDGPTMKVSAPGADDRIMAVPSRGLVYVIGDIAIHGQARDVTFVATRKVTITDDLTSDRAGTDSSNIGIIAGGDIAFRSGSGDLLVHASLLAANGTVYHEDLFDEVGGQKVVTIRGSVIARYHPAIGTFDRTTGALVSGLVTDLAYPTAAPNPPYFLEPVRAQWERIDLTEIAVADNDLTDGITPTPLRGLPPVTPACAGPAPAPYDGTYLRACLRLTI